MMEDYFQYSRSGAADPSQEGQAMSDFSAEDWNNLSAFVSQRSCHRGDRIIEQGSTGRSLYIVLTGSVDVVIRGLVKSRTIAQIGAGSMFGEMTFFTDQPRSADVIATTETDLLIIDKDAFDRLSAWHPHTALKLMKGIARILSQRVRGASIDL